MRRVSDERGVALILVVFVVALATIIVTNLAYTSYLGARLSDATVQNLQAEYLLKSAINLARAMVHIDKSREDSILDPWGAFVTGQAIPPEMLGVDIPELLVEVEITPETGKFPLRMLLTRDGGEVDEKWKGATLRLFRRLGFDDDTDQIDHTKIFPDHHFKADELLSMLIDYMDADSEPYEDEGGELSPGRENVLPKDYFPNTRIKRIGEMSSIPGFTPERMRKLTPLITVFDRGRINVNLAPKVVLESLHEEIDSSMVDAITGFRSSTPFDNVNISQELGNIVGDDVYQAITTMIGVETGWFQVLAKVQIGDSTYFMRSYISKSSDEELPVVRQVELFY